MSTKQNTVIRRLNPADLPDLYEIYRSHAFIANTSRTPFLSHAEIDQLFLPNDNLCLVAETQEKVVGHVTLFFSSKPREKHCASLAIGVAASYQNQGIGKSLMLEAINQADNWHNIRRIELDVLTDNIKAINLYKSLGFIEEGEKVDATFSEGKFQNLKIMARVKT